MKLIISLFAFLIGLFLITTLADARGFKVENAEIAVVVGKFTEQEYLGSCDDCFDAVYRGDIKIYNVLHGEISSKLISANYIAHTSFIDEKFVFVINKLPENKYSVRTIGNISNRNLACISKRVVIEQKLSQIFNIADPGFDDEYDSESNRYTCMRIEN